MCLCVVHYESMCLFVVHYESMCWWAEMSLASQTMYKSVKETYEPGWSGYSETISSAEVSTQSMRGC